MDADAVARWLRTGAPDLDVVDRGDPRFERARRTWNAMADRRPAAIAMPTTAAEVAHVVRVAAEHDLLLAVRGGGHSLPGLSTCDDGVVLDLGRLRAVEVDPRAQRAVVGGGALLGDLDAAGAPFGLVTPAGVVSHTGVGGLTLGGGMGWLSRRFGLTIDSLVAAEMVLADGRIVTVDAEHEPELFWGIRGGGGNFGVVTSFHFRMHPLGDVLIGEWDYPTAEARDVLSRYQALASRAPREVTSAFNITPEGLSVTALVSGSRSDASELLARYGAIGSVRSASVGAKGFLGLQSRADEGTAWGRRWYAKGGFFDVLDDSIIERIAAAIDDAPSPDAEVYCIQLGGAVTDVDADATAYVGRDAGHYWIVQPVWDDPADDARFVGWGRQHAGRLAERSMSGNYVNEQADADAAVARDAYGRDTFARLRALKAVVDPSNRFRLNQNIPPADAGATIDRGAA